ncbi:MAG: Bax inhibitor-1 family protein [Acidimicrobiales bacterium]
MSEWAPDYETGGGLVRSDDTQTLFGQTMGLVAATAGLFALGAYLGRSLSYGLGFVLFLGALGCLIAMRFAVQRSVSSAMVLLFAFGLLVGLATAPTLQYYSSTNPEALWQAGGATALFMLALGAVGYATRRDLSALARGCFWALLVLILLGIVLIFAQIPSGALVYSIAGLVIFAGLTAFDFQRLRRIRNIDSAPLLAASIFLDALNVFLFFLSIFNRRD